MSYIFPRRVLRAQDVLDPIELTLDISPAAERLSGRLNAHNLNQNIAATVPVQTDTFYALTRYALPVAFGDTHVPVSPDLYNGFPDSTTPATLPCAKVLPISANSTNTMSPKVSCACLVMPTKVASASTRTQVCSAWYRFMFTFRCSWGHRRLRVSPTQYFEWGL